MEKFITLTSVAAPLLLDNIDTDMIIPKQYLKTIKRTGLGEHLFDEMRYNKNGEDIPDFILNKGVYHQAKILLSGKNFGCGSSREHAPWALKDFGITCVMASSFADIFYGNCVKNGILLIVLDEQSVEQLVQIAIKPDHIFTVDLQAQQIVVPATQTTLSFEIEPNRKNILLNGLDDITLTEQHQDKIKSFEAADSQQRPWLYQTI